MNGRKTILAVVFALVAAGAVRADMVRVFQGDTEPPLPAVIRDRDDPHVASAFDISILCLGADLGLPPTGISPDMPVEAIDSGEPPVASLILADKQGSLGLCLYALVSLGMCKSAPWVKRMSRGLVPGWYHDGGPFQIGDRRVLSSDCLCPSLVCFVQAEPGAQSPRPAYCRELIISLWRESQFSPVGLASRGPPSLAPELLCA
ncbi:MAG: hypothetical protein KBE65_13215 [Phycisphaerae bacterium]|nr:hypothetical protein [Phycisphaerae bacterium]